MKLYPSSLIKEQAQNVPTSITMTHNFIRRLTEIKLLMTRDETRLPRKLLLVLEKQICTLMPGAEEQSKQLPYVQLRPVWSRERLLLWQLRAGSAQRGPRTEPRHGFLQTEPGQSNSQCDGAAGGCWRQEPEEAQAAGLCRAGLCPHSGRPRGSAPLRPSGCGRSAPHGAVRGRSGRRVWAGRHRPPSALGTPGNTEPGSSLPPCRPPGPGCPFT